MLNLVSWEVRSASACRYPSTRSQRYSGPVSTYSVQCVFAHNFITPTFIEEQKNKPGLTKRLEGTTGDLERSGKASHLQSRLLLRLWPTSRKGTTQSWTADSSHKPAGLSREAQVLSGAWEYGILFWLYLWRLCFLSFGLAGRRSAAVMHGGRVRLCKNLS